MIQARVYRNEEEAGVLIKNDNGTFTFRYHDVYFANPDKKSISLTLSKQQQEYISETLFPFFSNLLAEGVNRRLQSKHLQIDENDSFALLLATAGSDTVGAVTVKPGI
jgi:serine/threonine-protein kinase HipA